MSKTNASGKLRANPAVPRPDWHALDHDTVLAELASSQDGLSVSEAAERLMRYGPNRLSHHLHRTNIERFISQFRNLLIYILLGAAGITALIGNWADAAVIAAVVLINAIIGFLQEGRAERAIEAIRTLLSEQTTVLRDGQRNATSTSELVPGDVVLLEAGDRVPADLRLLRARSLMAEEAALTGESIPVEKHISAVCPRALLGDKRAAWLLRQAMIQNSAALVECCNK